MCSNCNFMDCYTFLEWSHFCFLRVEHWGGRLGVTYATCMTVSDLMWRLLLNAHSFIQNNKLCTLRKTYVDLKSHADSICLPSNTVVQWATTIFFVFSLDKL